MSPNTRMAPRALLVFLVLGLGVGASGTASEGPTRAARRVLGENALRSSAKQLSRNWTEPPGPGVPGVPDAPPVPGVPDAPWIPEEPPGPEPPESPVPEPTALPVSPPLEPDAPTPPTLPLPPSPPSPVDPPTPPEPPMPPDPPMPADPPPPPNPSPPPPPPLSPPPLPVPSLPLPPPPSPPPPPPPPSPPPPLPKCAPQSVPKSDRCAYVESTQTCSEHDRLVPYLKLQYCSFKGGKTRTLLFQITATLILLTIQYTASRRFFQPALENLSCFFRMSEDIAGATLLALANAVPWAIARWMQIAKECTSDGCVGGFGEDPRQGEGLRILVSEILRSAAFLVVAVLPVVIIATPHGMGIRKLRNEDDEGDETHEHDLTNPFVPPRRGYTSVLSNENSEDENKADTNANIGNENGASKLDTLDAPLLEEGAQDEDDEQLPVSTGVTGAFPSDDHNSSTHCQPTNLPTSLQPSPRLRSSRSLWRDMKSVITEKGGVDVERFPFVRDTGFCLAAVIMTMVVAGDGSVTGNEARGLVYIYVLYLLVAVLPNVVRVVRNGNSSNQNESTGAVNTSAPSHGTFLHNSGLLDHGETFDDGYAALIDGDGTLIAHRDGPTNGAPGMRWGGGGAGSSRSGATDRTTSTTGLSRSAVVLQASRGGAFTLESFNRYATTFANVLPVLVSAPFVFVLRLTMPDLGGDPNRRSRLLVALLPITAPLFFITSTRVFPYGQLDWDAEIYGAACGVFGSIALYAAWPFLLKPDAPVFPVKLIDCTLTLVAFVVSTLWIHLSAGELMSLVNSSAVDVLGWAWEGGLDNAGIGKANNSSHTIVSQVWFRAAVPWARDSGTLWTSLNAARVGKPALAVASVLAQSVFETLVGLGGSVLAAENYGAKEGSNSGLIITGDSPKQFWTNGTFVLTLFVTLTLTYMLFAVPLAHEWRVGRVGACAFLGIYFSWCCVSGVIDVGAVANKQWL